MLEKAWKIQYELEKKFERNKVLITIEAHVLILTISLVPLSFIMVTLFDIYLFILLSATMGAFLFVINYFHNFFEESN